MHRCARSTSCLFYMFYVFFIIWLRSLHSREIMPVKVKLSHLLPSVGPEADPCVQAVNPQVTFCHPAAVGCHYFPPGHLSNRRTSPPFDQYQVILLGDRGTCINNLPKVVTPLCSGGDWTHDLLIASPTSCRYATAPPMLSVRFILKYL